MKQQGNLLYVIAVILIIGWAIGFIGYNASGLIHILLVIAIIAILLRIIAGNDESQYESVIEDEPAKPEQPKSVSIIEKIIVVNNRTDKEYEYVSENDLGLTWQSSGENISIKQRVEDDGELTHDVFSKQKYRAMLTGFSITKVVRKDVENKE